MDRKEFKEMKEAFNKGNLSEDDIEDLFTYVEEVMDKVEKYEEIVEDVKSDYVTYESERIKLERAYALDHNENEFNRYSRVRDKGAVEVLSTLLFTLGVDEYELKEEARNG